jgi:hypothetical protein
MPKKCSTYNTQKLKSQIVNICITERIPILIVHVCRSDSSENSFEDLGLQDENALFQLNIGYVTIFYLSNDKSK